jgi:hypothetical protein
VIDKDPDEDKVHEKPEKRDVVADINPEGKYEEMDNMVDNKASKEMGQATRDFWCQ